MFILKTYGIFPDLFILRTLLIIANYCNSIHMIKRDAEALLERIIATNRSPKNVILVEGARQVGKTFLVNRVLEKYPNVIKINLESNKLLREKIDLTESFESFTKLLELETGFTKESIIFFDEAQESEKLGGYIRSMKEIWKNTTCILSGSSMTRLFRNDTRVPVGRIARLNIHSCNFIEFLRSRKKSVLEELIFSFPKIRGIEPVFHNELLSELDLYLNIGGLPEVINSFNQGEDFQRVRRTIMLDQQEDFLRKSSLTDPNAFQDGLRGVANYLSSPSKYSHIQRSTTEAKEIFSLLESWHLVLKIEQHGIVSTSSFNPKRYLYDIGIAQEIRNSPFPRLSFIKTLNPALRTDLGGLLENLILLQLLSNGTEKISSWRKNNKERVEVDFILKHEQSIPIECKSALSITLRSFQYVRTFLNQSGGKTGFVTSPAPYKVLFEDGKKLINLPLYLCIPEVIEGLC